MKISKKILGILTIIGLGRCVFSPQGILPNTAHAQNTSTATSSSSDFSFSKMTMLDIIDMFLKVIYIILWPLLFLAGVALDNSMVYGSFLHMDAPLRQFWNIIKNFANFALGFMVLIAILKSIFAVGGAGSFKEDSSPMGVIKKTLIAGVLIQASRFLMAALIDVSTIATYAVGGMPLSVLKNTSLSFATEKILMSNSSMDLNNLDTIGEKDFKVRYSTSIKSTDGKTSEKVDISPCKVMELGANNEMYIVGRTLGDEQFKNDGANNTLAKTALRETDFPTRNICVFANKVYFFNEFPNTRKDAKTNADYQSVIRDNLNTIGGYTDDLENCGFIININYPRHLDTAGYEGCKIKEYIANGTYSNNGQTMEDLSKTNKNLLRLTKDGINTYASLLPAPGMDKTVFYGKYGGAAGNSWFQQTAAPTIAQVIDSSKGFVGPLVTIYASLMDFANLTDTTIQNESMSKGIGDFLIRVGVAVGLFFPLLALAVVLFIRVGFLRAVIATSPLIILAQVFKRKILEKQISIENIIKTIFAPVITVFALSISLIFMTAISGMLKTDNLTKIDFYHQMGMEFTGKNSTTDQLDIFGMNIEYPKIVGAYGGATGDWFSWMIVSFCGIGIMRFVLFAAIKATGTIGEVGEKIQQFGSNVMKTAPIIPTPIGNAGIGTLQNKFTTETAQTAWNNNIVDLKGQQERMGQTLETKMPTFFKKDFDTEFNNIESGELQNYLAKNDMQGALEYAKQQKMTVETPEQRVELIYNTPELKEILEKGTQEQKESLKTARDIGAVLTAREAAEIITKTKETISGGIKDVKNIEEANTKLEGILKNDKTITDDVLNKMESFKINDKEYTINKEKDKRTFKPIEDKSKTK